LDDSSHDSQGGWRFSSRLFIAAICGAGALFTALALTAGSSPAPPAGTPYTGFFVVGEELTYEVSYLMIKLGTITIRVPGIERGPGWGQFRTEAIIKTYKGIPFMHLLTVFQSTISDQMVSTSFGTREYYQDTTWKYINYAYDQKKDLVYISERIGNKRIPQNCDTLKLEGKRWQDGLSLFFLARSRSAERKEEHVPTLIYRSKADTYIRFGQERSSVEIDAVGYPVAVNKLEGEAGFTGIFGLTGGFAGWFSADSARVPIMAKMRVYIGNVNIELIKWKRPGWAPPRAK
jgi:hypothetical protein